MGNHRAERGSRRATSADRATRKPLITRHAGQPARAAATPAEPALEARAVSRAAEATNATPVSRPGKRAARPAPQAKAPRSASTRALRAERKAEAKVSRSRVETPVAPPARRSAPSAGAVRVAPATTEILTPANGKRRAVKHSGSRGPLFKGLPSAPILAGVAALAVSAGGAVTVAGPTASDSLSPASEVAAAGALSQARSTDILEERTAVVSRDSRREAKSRRSEAKLLAKAEAAAEQRSETLQTITVKAEKQAAKIEANQWVMPLQGYRLSATFGMSSSLWSTVHTGLDFAAPSGTPLRAVANGVITEVGYDGSYGNKTVLTLEDGTEVWYCHQTSMGVSVGDKVVGGEVIGTVGSTGNSTGPHLHLEIRPGGGSPVNPYSHLILHGLNP